MNQLNSIQFSIIVPVYNRPDEVRELLHSLCRQTYTDFEVIIVEDGSSVLSEKVCRDFMGRLDLKYHYKENSGPGLSRNYGMKKANGNYFIILDSDVIVPDNYMQTVYNALQNDTIEAYGGPDAAHKSFTSTQKAINYAMTSIWTTGGIRGTSEKVEKFHPRSFNMGCFKEVFERTGGFSAMRYGEDIDFSIRIKQAGFKTQLLSEAFVYHKRRNDLKSFFKQVYHSGQARIDLFKKHPQSLKLVHFFPAVFTLGFLISLIWFIFGFKIPLFLYFIYGLILIFDASLQYKNIKLGLFSALASFVMLLGYGWGFIKKGLSK